MKVKQHKIFAAVRIDKEGIAFAVKEGYRNSFLPCFKVNTFYLFANIFVNFFNCPAVRKFHNVAHLSNSIFKELLKVVTNETPGYDKNFIELNRISDMVADYEELHYPLDPLR